MSKVKIAKGVLKAAYKAGRFRERWAPGSMRPRRRTAVKAFTGGVAGSVVGSYLYDEIKPKKGGKK